ncbi:MAG: hypothetical protein JWN28_270 [Candidatus Saccharibacteria bacterium]|nr:hypothetical protein [Candidatus Saccharibacteria bacterium]
MNTKTYQNKPLVITLSVIFILSIFFIVGDRVYSSNAKRDCFTKARSALGISTGEKLKLGESATAAVAYSTYNDMCLANEYGL